MPRLILASSSPYRRELLSRLHLPYEVIVPQVDETPRPGEAAEATALRLAQLKAQTVAEQHRNALVIGSDQVAMLGSTVLGKPLGFDAACDQLRAASGRTVIYHTALCLLNSATGQVHACIVPTRVVFRKLDEATITRYLEKEQPYNCAGSAKVEGLGITLMEKFEGEDPTALVGLPLIALSAMLRKEGVALP